MFALILHCSVIWLHNTRLSNLSQEMETVLEILSFLAPLLFHNNIKNWYTQLSEAQYILILFLIFQKSEAHYSYFYILTYRTECTSEFFLNFSILKQFFGPNWINRCDCWGPDGRLDTKINQTNKCHIFMSHA